MNELWLKTILRLPLKYIFGFVFAIPCFIAAMLVSCIFARGTSCIGGLGIVLGGGFLVGVPIGAVLGIYLLDKFILEVVVLKQQIISGCLTGAAASVFLWILELNNVGISSLLPYEGTEQFSIMVGIFYITGVLAALLGYTIAGLTKRKKTQKVSSQ